MYKLYNTAKDFAINLSQTLSLNLSSRLNDYGNLVIKTIFRNN